MAITQSRPVVPAPSHRSFVEFFKILLDWLRGIPHLLSNDTSETWSLFACMRRWCVLVEHVIMIRSACWKVGRAWQFNPCLQVGKTDAFESGLAWIRSHEEIRRVWVFVAYDIRHYVLVMSVYSRQIMWSNVIRVVLTYSTGLRWAFNLVLCC